MRTRYQGIREVVTYNWPLYAAALATIAGCTLAQGSRSKEIRAAAAIAGTTAAWWSVASIVAAHWVHDRSDLYTMRWCDDLVRPPRRWALLHAGHDEHSGALAARFGPGDVFDFYDPTTLTEDSIARARRRSARTGERRRPERLELQAGAYDAVFVLLALHEIRDDALRTHFLAQLRDALAPEGRVVLADHLLDLANVVAFGPGARHFLAGPRYRAAIADARLVIERERDVTPFVRVFIIRR